MKKLIAGVAFLAAFGVSAAYADSYYIVREHGAKECHVVKTKPTTSTTVVIGNKAYTSETEARGAIKTVCHD
jgi:predicted CoA-binding protein